MFNSLQDRLQNTFDALRGKGRLTEDDINVAMREIRMALLEADVNYRVVKNFVARCKEQCLTAEVLDSLSPAQNVVRIVLNELTSLLGSTESKLTLAQNRIPNVIMLVGLQGSGKTTAAAKLAYLLKSEGKHPLLAACDVHRPVSPFGVVEQLREPLDARKAELRAEDVETFEVRKTFLVVHFPTFLRVSPDRRGALRRPSSSPSPLRVSRALFPRRRAAPS